MHVIQILSETGLDVDVGTGRNGGGSLGKPIGSIGNVVCIHGLIPFGP